MFFRRFLLDKDIADNTGKVNYWGQCFPGQGGVQAGGSKVPVDDKFYAIGMGIVVDAGFYLRSMGVASGKDKDMRNYVVATLVDSNKIYSNQMNVKLTLGKLLMGDGATPISKIAPDSNGDCPDTNDPNKRLYNFRDWRGARWETALGKEEQIGLWHLYTNCHPAPGTVGVAFVGVLCHRSYGVGWSNFLRGGSTWEVVAHEIGHNFGASHSFENGQGRTGGIMDYGEGKVGGVYQFNNLRKSEVCKEITNALSPFFFSVGLNTCWSAVGKNAMKVGGGTGSATAAPTNTPAITPQPSNKPSARPSPRPTRRPTKRPTARPVATRQTTEAPATPAPTFRFTYSWNPTTSWGQCSPKCGPANTTSIQSQIVDCLQVDESGAMTDVVVDDRYCTFTQKPLPDTRSCTVPTCPPVEAKCGNGIVEQGERCDTGTDSCCKTTCKGWIGDDNCLDKNPTIDALWMDATGKLYKFQGSYFARYSTGEAQQKADRKYPKNIYRKLGWRNTWTGDIGAVLSQPGGYLHVFKKLDYIVVDWNNRDGPLKAQRDAGVDFGLPDDFKACGEVTAALSFATSAVLICHNIYVMFSFGSKCKMTKSRPVADFGIATNETESVVAAYTNPLNNYAYIYVGERKAAAYLQEYGTQEDQLNSGNQGVQGIPLAFVGTTFSIFSGGATADDSDDCDDKNCARCKDNGKTCTKCDDDYKLYKTQCVHASIVSVVTFDKDSEIDDIFLKDGLAQLKDLGNKYDAVPALWGGNGGEFTRTTRIELAKPSLPQGKMAHWKVTAWYKPTQAFQNNTFLTLIEPDGRKVIIRFQEYNETQDPKTFRIWVTYFGIELFCYVQTPLKMNKWNKIEISFVKNIFKTGVNQAYHQLAYDVTDQGIWDNISDFSVSFHQWYIGDDTNSVTGVLDQFVVSDPEYKSKSKSSESDTERVLKILGIVLACLVGICICACIYVTVKNRWAEKQIKDEHTPVSTYDDESMTAGERRESYMEPRAPAWPPKQMASTGVSDGAGHGDDTTRMLAAHQGHQIEIQEPKRGPPPPPRRPGAPTR